MTVHVCRISPDDVSAFDAWYAIDPDGGLSRRELHAKVRQHRGHRLGLALKVANLDTLETSFPGIALVVTGNASENAPMVAVNEMLGFEVVANGTFGAPG